MTVGEHPSVSFEPCEVLRELGVNGAGVVHLALDRDRAQNVAIEFLDRLLAADQAAAGRLCAAAQVLTQRRHPNIATIDAGGESPEGRPFLVMEPVEGQPLSELIAAQTPCSGDDAFAILLQITLGVQYLHEQGVTPLRLRPDSILIGVQGHATLMPSSFLAASAGLAPAAPDSGDTLYLAPEEVRGGPGGRPADVYRLGLIAYEVFSGHQPFGGTGEALIEEQLHASPPSLVRFNPDLPGPVMRAIQRALAKKPEARPAGAAAFADLLLGVEPEPAGPAEEPDSGAELAVRPAAAVETPPLPDLAETEPAQSRVRRWRWLGAGGVMVIIVVAALAALALRGRGGTATQTAVATPAATPAAVATAAAATAAVAPPAAIPVATAALPAVSELTVCNDVFACKQTGFVARGSVAVCFALSPAQGGASLLAVVTAGGSRAANANAPAAIARSAPISGDQPRSCYLVPLPATLPPGPYTAWVLDGASVLGQRDFTAVAP